ncbi:MAG: TonB-dependent receptor, partial [Candidatus Binatia bacterium]
AKPRTAPAIEEIVVTARKTEESIQDVPVSVTAISAEGLEQTSTFEMKELGLRIPNMTITSGPAQPTALTFQIRGQVQNDILGTLDPSVGFYDDGVYVARPHGANAAFVDVKNVQVLRGPQGTLFGRNTTGGAVLLSTNDPDFEAVSGAVSATGGSFGRRKFNGILNLPVWTDTLAVRVVGEKLLTDGFAFDAVNQRKVATENHDLLRAKILYKPFEGLSFSLAGQYIDADFLGTPVQPVFALKPTQAQQVGVCCLASLNSTAGGVDYDRYVLGDPDRVDYDAGLEPTSTITVKSLTFTPVWDLPWATVKLIAGVRRNEDVGNRIDIDASPSKIVDTLQANENTQQS